MADAIKSLDQRTIWEISDTGEFTEIGPRCQKYTIGAIDAEIILELLLRNKDRIHNEANKQRGRMYGGKFANTYL